MHREALATDNLARQEASARQAEQMMELLAQNTQLTEVTQELSKRIETLTSEIHRKVTTA